MKSTQKSDKRIAVIGAGISGLSVARLLHKDHTVNVIEREERPGGLVKCSRVKDNLFHMVGGHVFNSRNQGVLDWFWGHFDREKEFNKATRNAKILLNGKVIGYPLENYLHQLDAETVSSVLDDMLARSNDTRRPEDYPNFAEFLEGNFGKTLYQLYFKPYNTKIWNNTDLSKVPLEWLDGKLPMPNLKQMLMSNIIRKEEGEMVHATFYYAKENGSQFIVDRLSEGLDIFRNTELHSLKREDNQWLLNDEMYFDAVVYCGDVRKLDSVLDLAPSPLKAAAGQVTHLQSNGTSNIFCETDPTDISWLYLPDASIKAHRIIYTGNFAESNSRGSQRQTCVVEFSGKHEYADMVAELAKLPGNLSPLHYNYEPNSYIVHQPDTKAKIEALRSEAEPHGLYLLGRFAEWEYYNMDKAIEAAFATSDRIKEALD